MVSSNCIHMERKSSYWEDALLFLPPSPTDQNQFKLYRKAVVFPLSHLSSEDTICYRLTSIFDFLNHHWRKSSFTVIMKKRKSTKLSWELDLYLFCVFPSLPATLLLIVSSVHSFILSFSSARQMYFYCKVYNKSSHTHILWDVVFQRNWRMCTCDWTISHAH